MHNPSGAGGVQKASLKHTALGMVILGWAYCLTGPLPANRAPPAALAGGKARESSREYLRASNSAPARQLAVADELVAQGHWDEALAEYLQLMDRFGTHLVPVEPDRYIPVRLVCQQRLATAPAAVLQRYRRQVDARARQWLEQGTANRDLRLLRRVVEETFCSSVGDVALDRLGDVLFERGRFDEAEAAWQRIAPLSGEAKGDVPPSFHLPFYPDPKVDLARVRAKQLLARLFAGREEAFAAGWQAFRAAHAEAAGVLAGTSGKYVDILREIARTAERPRLADAWTTYAGNATRNFTLPQASIEFADLRRTGPRWMVKEQGGGPPRLHPLVIGDKVLIHDGKSVVAIDATTGVRKEWYRLTEADRLSQKGTSEGERLTLTAAEGRLYACLGRWLICLDIREDGRLRWKVSATGPERAEARNPKPETRFAGAPIVIDDKIYVGMISVGEETVAEVACYDGPTGALRWRQEVGRASDRAQARPAQSYDHLLTRAGQYVVYNTQLGVIAALDADTGQFGWAVLYRHQALDREPQVGNDKQRSRASGLRSGASADPNPCLYADRFLFVAPRDDGRLFCLDAATGYRIWETPDWKVRHLLGIVADRLIVTTARDIRGVDVQTGAVRWRQPPEGNLVTSGRGFLAGGLVFWPTQAGLRVLDAQTGGQARDPRRYDHIPPGNLVSDGTRWVVATGDRVMCYGP